MLNRNPVTPEQKLNSDTNADTSCVCPTSAKPLLAVVLNFFAFFEVLFAFLLLISMVWVDDICFLIKLFISDLIVLLATCVFYKAANYSK